MGGEVGDPHLVEPRYVDGELAGVAIWHDCQANGRTIRTYHWAPVESQWPVHWDLVSEHPLTIAPSLLCRSCGDHGFVQNGEWIQA